MPKRVDGPEQVTIEGIVLHQLLHHPPSANYTQENPSPEHIIHLALGGVHVKLKLGHAEGICFHANVLSLAGELDDLRLLDVAG